jgi:hypothetical protein
MRISFEFSFIMENPIPTPNSMEMGMGKKSPRLLNEDGDEMALPGGEQTRCHPYPRGARRLRLLRRRLIRLHRLHLVFLVLHLHCMGSRLLSPTISPWGMFGMAAPIRTATLTSGQLLMRSPWSTRSRASSVRAWLAKCWRRLVRHPSIRLWLCYRRRLLWLLEMGTPSSKAVVLCCRP